MPPLLPVITIVRVQRTALSLNFRMPSDGDVVVPCEPCPAIHEVPFGIEVFRPKPRRRLGGRAIRYKNYAIENWMSWSVA